MQWVEERLHSEAIHGSFHTSTLSATYIRAQQETILAYKHEKYLEKTYQFMHSVNIWTTKFVNFTHACTIIFQCRNNCSSNIRNIYWLNPVEKEISNIKKAKNLYEWHIIFLCSKRSMILYSCINL